jgi:hypothetical protein
VKSPRVAGADVETRGHHATSRDLDAGGSLKGNGPTHQAIVATTTAGPQVGCPSTGCGDFWGVIACIVAARYLHVVA